MKNIFRIAFLLVFTFILSYLEGSSTFIKKVEENFSIFFSWRYLLSFYRKEKGLGRLLGRLKKIFPFFFWWYLLSFYRTLKGLGRLLRKLQKIFRIFFLTVLTFILSYLEGSRMFIKKVGEYFPNFFLEGTNSHFIVLKRV